MNRAAESPRAWENLVLVSALLGGGLLRILPAALSDFPLNDGGLFYAMVRDLQANGLRLPVLTSYNGGGIPFAYPPLALYITALLNNGLGGGDLLGLFRWLPAALTLASLPAFFALAKTALPSRSLAVLATVAFAFLPRTYSWFVLGGGISRASYLLLYLLAARALLMLFREPGFQPKTMLATTLWCSLLVLSHPEAAVHGATTGVLFWLLLAPRRAGTIKAAAVGLGVLLLTAAWWGVVLAQHGLAPFISAGHTGGHSLRALWFIFVPLLGEEQLLPLLTSLGLLGLALQLGARRWLLLAWFAVPLVVLPRSAPAISILPLALAAGVGLNAVLSQVLAQRQPGANWAECLMRSRLAQAGLAYVLIFSLASGFLYSVKLSSLRVSPAERSALIWVTEHSPPDSRFLLLTGRPEAFADPLAEWFPALTGRRAVTTIQGQEWRLGPDFQIHRQQANRLQTCAAAGLACLVDWQTETGWSADYLLLSAEFAPGLLANQLGSDTGYQLVYSVSGVSIFQVVRP